MIFKALIIYLSLESLNLAKISFLWFSIPFILEHICSQIVGKHVIELISFFLSFQITRKFYSLYTWLSSYGAKICHPSPNQLCHSKPLTGSLWEKPTCSPRYLYYKWQSCISKSIYKLIIMNQDRGICFSSRNNVINIINDEFHRPTHKTPVWCSVGHPSNLPSIHLIPSKFLLCAKQHALHQTASESFMVYLQLIRMKAQYINIRQLSSAYQEISFLIFI